MANNRIIYATQAIGLGKSPTGTGSIETESSSFKWMKGVQQANLSTNFNLEQVFEYGQLEVYENIENIPEIELTITKAIDGRESLYLMAVGETGKVSTAAAAAASNKVDAYLVVYPDTASAVSGINESRIVYCSGMVINNCTVTLSVDGNSTEAITLQGNDKNTFRNTTLNLNTGFATLADTPHAPDTHVARRQHFIPASSSIPSEVAAAIRGGVGNIQTITTSIDFGRENTFELGAFRPYAKNPAAFFPITCDFEVISLSGDMVNASGDGTNLPSTNAIKIFVDVNGTSVAGGQFVIDIGNRAKLTSVTYGGGDTGGGNATATYSYQTFNKFLVTDSLTYWT